MAAIDVARDPRRRLPQGTLTHVAAGVTVSDEDANTDTTVVGDNDQTDTLLQFNVYDPKYILRPPLVWPPLFPKPVKGMCCWWT